MNFLSSCRKKFKDLDYGDYKAPGDSKPMFVFPLRNRFIQEGVGVKLIASIEGKPKPDVSTLIIYRDMHLKISWDQS